RAAAPATTNLEPGAVLAQRYRIQRLLGKGGMGAVYLADDEVLGELVALKVISSAFAHDETAMIARFRREAAAARQVSSPSVIRTPHYMAPEQVRGKPVDARTDVYALGALAYHLVCGRPPFLGDNAIAVGFAHCSEAPTPPRQIRKDLPAALDAAILAALEKS